jgi:hypothetical protein
MVDQSVNRKLLHRSDRKNFIFFLIICSLITLSFLIFFLFNLSIPLGVITLVFALYTCLGILVRKGKSDKLSLVFIVTSWIFIAYWILDLILFIYRSYYYNLFRNSPIVLYYCYAIILSLLLLSVLGIVFLNRVRRSYKELHKEKHRLLKN